MLITSFACVTQSLFHNNQEDTARKIREYPCLIFTSFGVDSVIAFVAFTVGVVAFLSLSTSTLGMLPLTSKIILVSSGFILFITDALYFYYRINQAANEQKRTIQRLESEKQEVKQDFETVLLENGQQMAVCIQELEISKKRLHNQLEGAKQDILILQSSSGEEKALSIAIQIKDQIEILLKEVDRDLNELKEKTKDCALTIENLKEV